MLLIDTQTELPPQDLRDTARQERHSLRRLAGEITDNARLQACGATPTGPTVEIWREGGGAHFRGLETCGSIWQCPVCSNKILNRRADEVQELADAHEKAGGAVYMATFTLRHHAFNKCRSLRDTVAQAWQKMQAGAPWARLKNRYGIAHTVRALEVTHGRNGWHPHIHVLLLTERALDDTEAEMLRLDLFERWETRIRKLGGSSEIGAFDLRRASTGAEAAAYVAKWGAGHEIAKGAQKEAAGRSVWNLLKASEHDDGAARLFREYAKAFFRARHLTYSKGSREAYDLRYPATDAELAIDGKSEGETIDKETGEVLCAESGRVALLDFGTWRRICTKGLTGALLDAAAEGGSEGVTRFLNLHDCHSYYDAREHPAPNYAPPPAPRRRAFDPYGSFSHWQDVADFEEA